MFQLRMKSLNIDAMYFVWSMENQIFYLIILVFFLYFLNLYKPWKWIYWAGILCNDDHWWMMEFDGWGKLNQTWRFVIDWEVDQIERVLLNASRRQHNCVYNRSELTQCDDGIRVWIEIDTLWGQYLGGREIKLAWRHWLVTVSRFGWRLWGKKSLACLFS